MGQIKTATLKIQLLDQATAKLGVISKAIKGLDAGIGRFDRSIAATRGQLWNAAGVAAAAGAALALPIKRAMEFESAMADVRKVVDFASPEAFKQMSADILELSKRLPMTADGLAAIVAAAGQSGLANNELVAFAEMAAKVGIAWDVTADEAGSALAKLKTSLGLSVADTGLLADAVNHLGNTTAASAPDILNFTRRVAPMAGQFGLTAEQAAAFGAAMIGAGFESEVAATSFLNMGRNLTVGASATKRQRTAMKALGLDAKQVSKSMQKDALGTISDVFDRLRAVPDHMRAALMADIFGNEARALAPLLGNAELLAQVMALVAEKTTYAGSAQKEFDERAKTTGNTLQLLRNRVTAVGITFGTVLLPAINDAAGALGPYVVAIGRFVEAHPRFIKGAVAATAGLLGLRVAALAGKLGFLLLGRQVLIAGRGALLFAGWAQRAAGGAIALQTALAALSGAKFGGLAKLAVGLRGLGLAVPGVAALKGALAGIGAVVAGISAPVAVVIGGLVAGGALIWKYWDRVSSIFSGVGRAIGEQLAPALATIRPALDWLAPIGSTIAAGWRAAVDALSGFGSWISSFFSREVLTDSQKAAWADSGYQAATALIESVKAKVSELVNWFSGLPGRIAAAIGRIDIGSLIRWPSLPGWLGGGGPQKPAAGADAAAVRIDGARAAGGPVRRAGAYLVGEKGPEIFSPGQSGRIVPNDEIGGSRVEVHAPITVSVKVEGESGGLDVARQVEAAVRQAMTSAMAKFDAQLNRSAQIQYGGVAAYGDR